jgi:hypothetical protein
MKGNFLELLAERSGLLHTSMWESREIRRLPRRVLSRLGLHLQVNSTSKLGASTRPPRVAGKRWNAFLSALTIEGDENLLGEPRAHRSGWPRGVNGVLLLYWRRASL